MKRLALVVSVIVLAAVACDTGAADTTSVAPTITAASTSTTVAHTGPPRALIATTEGGIAIVDIDGNEQVSIPASADRRFRQPMWLDSTTLVAGVTGTDGHGLAAFDARDASAVWTVAMETPPFFTLPAPASSTFATTSLRNNLSGDGLIAELVDRGGRVTALSTESPFYASWAPDGRTLAIHSSGTHLDLLSGGSTRTIAAPTGVFQAPVWVARGLVTLRSMSDQTLAVWNEGSFTDLGGVRGPVRFVGSDRRLALQSTPTGGGGVPTAIRVQSELPLPDGALIIIDLDTSEVETVTASVVPMFQWSPSGDELLFATVVDSPRLSLAWHVWESDASIRDVGIFDAQPGWFGDVAPFFDQYAQAMSLWSSDGTHIGLPAIEEGEPVVIIEEIDGSARTVVPGGVWIAFSP